MDHFQKNVELYNYIVLGSDSTCNAYKSLRNIADDINVDYSTISKKLKNSLDKLKCFVSPKGNQENFYYIIKIN
tara:strand:+ start:107 stop:328 length:222 start_codon:yes stop_codon:yes gene_type:complete